MQRSAQVKILYFIGIYASVHIKDYFLWLEKRRYFKIICNICKPRYNNRKLLVKAAFERQKQFENVSIFIRNGLKSIRILLENCINQFQSCCQFYEIEKNV